MSYMHQFIDQRTPITAGKIVCVGRNYLDHIHELNNPVPETPLIFMKPSTSLVSIENPIELPDYSQDCHHEIEIAVLLGVALKNATESQIESAIVGYAVALDLTLRDIQGELKSKGQPWEMAKAFDGSCPISPFVDKSLFTPDNIDFSLEVNGEIRQQGNSKMMMTKMLPLIAYMSRYFTLLPGDVILTGTPKGVQRLCSKDRLKMTLGKDYIFTTDIL